MRRILVSLTVLLTLVACGSAPATLLMVVVENRAEAVSPRSLSVSLSQDGKTLSHTLGAGGTVAFPSSFVIRAEGRSGAATVTVKALGGGGEVLARGSARTTIKANDAVVVRVSLTPMDSVVNTRTAGNQLLTSGATGRQVASDGLGNQVVVWVEQAAPGTPKVWYRLFDARGKPRVIAGTGGNKEARASQKAQPTYDHPAVAMLRGGPSAGRFVVVSLRSPDKGISTNLVRRVFLSTGAAAGPETEISLTGKATNPDVSVSVDGTAMVVWQERVGATAWKVMGLRLDAQGWSKSAQSITLASFTSNREPLPAVAGGQNGGFMVAWSEDGAVRGLILGGQKDQHKVMGPSFALASASAGAAMQADVAGLLYGYVAVWVDRGTHPPDASGTAVWARRFNYVGKALEREWVLNTTTAGDQQNPAVAVSDTGQIMVCWTQAGATSTDPRGGVRARVLLPDGLPVGADFQVNTTTGGLQARPSLAPVGLDAFVVAFTDNSHARPDTTGSAVRARLLFPAFGRTDGRVGALCPGQKTCGSGLYCDRKSKSGPRCTARCTAPGGTCIPGGTCVQDKTSSVIYCAH